MKKRISFQTSKAAGRKGVMDNAVHGHEALYGSTERMKNRYLLKKNADFSSAELIAIMNSFKDPSTPENPIVILSIANAAVKFEDGIPQESWLFT
ncbi:hypothetical protein F4811DRAFT_553819 [Daldinia bambusicola]|nr:hypothetical protein F4811DRAFT_553819 [Daldinia bambusicola]